MWSINKWDSQIILAETAFLYSSLEETIYMKILEVISNLLKENYMHDYILALIKCIYRILQAARRFLKEYIKTMTLSEGFNNY